MLLQEARRFEVGAPRHEPGGCRSQRIARRGPTSELEGEHPLETGVITEADVGRSEVAAPPVDHRADVEGDLTPGSGLPRRFIPARQGNDTRCIEDPAPVEHVEDGPAERITGDDVSGEADDLEIHAQTATEEHHDHRHRQRDAAPTLEYPVEEAVLGRVVGLRVAAEHTAPAQRLHQGSGAGWFARPLRDRQHEVIEQDPGVGSIRAPIGAHGAHQFLEVRPFSGPQLGELLRDLHTTR